MAGFRAYHKNLSSERAGDFLVLSADESRHLCGALRAREGDGLSVFDLSGLAFLARLKKASPREAVVELLEKQEFEKVRTRITIAQCLPKGGTFDTIINQSVQLGVSGIYPLLSERSIVRLDAKESAKKHEKWTSHVVESIKQSANMRGLELAPLNEFSNFLSSALPQKALKLVASLERDKARPLLDVLNDNKGGVAEICFLVGPEGDLSENEYAKAYEAGFLPVSLGETVMKCEVAAAFCASVGTAFVASSA